MDPAGGRGGQMEQRITEEMCRSLEQHGYREPIFLGKGSFSEVYRVRNREGHLWACKIAKASEVWERECRNSREISHPLFPDYREHWTDKDRGYLVIEYWEGMDLREMLDRQGRLPVEQAVEIAEQITEGLQYLHERPHPFLYRDLKPENIRIRADGRAGILDLGCLWNREQDWSGAGNYSYSAPEQFVPGELPGEESDVYAMGKILAAMLGEERDGGKNGQEKWLRRVIAMATSEERKERIPDMKTLRKLLAAVNASGRERRRACRAADFYYIRKLYCP